MTIAEVPNANLLDVDGVSVIFPGRGGDTTVRAVQDVSLNVRQGENLGLVGESGCGKSSLARAIMQLPPPTSGRVRFNGTELTGLRGRELRQQRRRIQMVFQDPIASLNPRRRIGRIVSEPLRSTDVSDDVVDNALTAVGLEPGTVRKKYASELSGGQCQRVSIARALVSEPDLLICDEAVSALDVSIQAQILNLLEELRQSRGISLLFISHDLAVVRNVSDRVAVMYLGKVCELAPADEIFMRPRHPYTRLLLDSIPGRRAVGAVRPVAAVSPAAAQVVPTPETVGCPFRARCPRAEPICAESEPPLIDIGSGHMAACHFVTKPDTRESRAADQN
ncbi:MAG TPA: ABC transporter ATP-binding protein [Acidimicrobiales bacterium]|jgi:peptide/nickel transport system ATP-binding protein|nr:ABC transporter ATP-binding protein [Acidimicrobiales bacterium]